MRLESVIFRIMEIRKTTINDLQRVMEIFSIARDFMKKSGNPSQWNDNYPAVELICSDIQEGISYVVLHNDRIVGSFVFIVGADPTYTEIDGKWLNDEPYGTIHRIASDGSTKGIADECLKFCKTITRNIRIDTHENNSVMLNWIIRAGFEKCGIIHVTDGTPRYAFQLHSDNFKSVFEFK